MRIDYSRFYRGTTAIPSYGKGANKKDTLVTYEFNTTDGHGNKIMDKMTKEETLQAMKDIRAQYGDAVIVEFSGDGMAALVEHEKGAGTSSTPQETTQGKGIILSQGKETAEEKNALFQQEIKHYDKSLNHLPAYAGKADGNGMPQGGYLGHGSGLRKTTDSIHMMQTMDQEAYAKFQNMDRSSDGGLAALKFLTNWYIGAVTQKPSMLDAYEKQMGEYEEKQVKSQKLDNTFDGLNTSNKSVYLESLRAFQQKNPNFLSSAISRELAASFWGK